MLYLYSQTFKAATRMDDGPAVSHAREIRRAGWPAPLWLRRKHR
ncbi:hypothetical protein FHS89_002595 [Rubricella aquisinus]|uniref:Uncharacterized protein n=1 Tax=Rubricella aquisinus TaxID=2028108 RepID=A0A840X1D5_9RHOB|nr:hypothetical protein [Rubricella aquisinus]